MTNLFWILAAVLLGGCVFSAHAGEEPNPAAPKAPEKEGWKLVWSDEFDYEGLPDPKKWTYEEGFVRNNELQYYTKGRKENARVEGGHLVIEGIKERMKNPYYKPGAKWPREKQEFAEYTAASIITKDKASWTYGRIEVRAKLPRGKGVWPAIWTLGDNIKTIGWPKCGEIDIMEYVGKERDNLYCNVHYHINGKKGSKGNKLAAAEPYKDFHVWVLDWNSERMEFYFDDKKMHTFDLDLAGKGPDNPFRKPQYLLLNLALGGSWGGEMDDSVLPQKYLIDYVRVYQKDDAAQKAAPDASKDAVEKKGE